MTKTIIIDVEVATRLRNERLEKALDDFFKRWAMMQDRGGWTPGGLVADLRKAVGK